MFWENLCDGIFLIAISFLRRVTFHYKRSSLSYFGGVCSRTRGVGVNEVNFVNS